MTNFEETMTQDAKTPIGPNDMRCGYVAILGAPNAGKSTLLNRIIGQKLSIISPKVQTTRAKVLGIQINGSAQIIYVDTPGIFSPRRRLDRAMVAAAWGGADDADMVILLVDAARGITDEVRPILERLRTFNRPMALALNKIDAVKRERLLGLAAELSNLGTFDQVFMISGLKGDGLPAVERWVGERLPKGHWLYPEDQISDIPQRLLAAEITREQLFLQLHNELPYETTVETESWEERKDGSAAINQVIYVQRAGQKAIVLGKEGHQIKRIGAVARKQLEDIFERKIHLFLFVKQREGWGEDRERYDAMGLNFDVERGAS